MKNCCLYLCVGLLASTLSAYAVLTPSQVGEVKKFAWATV